MIAVLRQIIEHGGLTVALIALVSLAALTIAIERAWRLLPLRRRFAAVRDACNDALLRAGPAQALAGLSGGDAMTRVLRAGLLAEERGAETMRLAARTCAQREVAGIERGLGVIQIAAQVAPWLGLMGTVVGLMEVFQHVGGSAGAAASPAAALATGAVAAGIGQALGATVAGLVVAITSYIAYSLLSGLSNRLIDELESGATDLPAFVGAVRPAAG